MSNSDQELNTTPARQINRARMALVESPSTVGTIPSQQPAIDESKQVKWWTLAPPVVILVVIVAGHFLSNLLNAKAEDEKPWLDDPILLQTSTRSKPSKGSSSGKVSVSSIAYSKSHAVAFVNDQMVSEGAVISGITVLKIHENSVQFEKGGKQWTQEVGN